MTPPATPRFRQTEALRQSLNLGDPALLSKVQDQLGTIVNSLNATGYWIVPLAAPAAPDDVRTVWRNDHGMVLVSTTGDEEPQSLEIPAWAVRAIYAQAGKDPEEEARRVSAFVRAGLAAPAAPPLLPETYTTDGKPYNGPTITKPAAPALDVNRHREAIRAQRHVCTTRTPEGDQATDWCATHSCEWPGEQGICVGGLDEIFRLSNDLFAAALRWRERALRAEGKQP